MGGYKLPSFFVTPTNLRRIIEGLLETSGSSDLSASNHFERSSNV